MIEPNKMVMWNTLRTPISCFFMTIHDLNKDMSIRHSLSPYSVHEVFQIPFRFRTGV